jgi:hypothetical protein
MYYRQGPGAGIIEEELLGDGCFKSGEIVQPYERDEEKRNVHRVREYWLEHEAMRYLSSLLSFRLPVNNFETHFTTVNRHNPKFSRASMRETIRTFFREHVDSSTGSRYLTLKLSERDVCVKPSKNILKRWNLSNGMLYFFYAAIGRTHPPSGDEILEPFYFQKRVDFIRKVCLPSDHKGADGSDGSVAASKSSSGSSNRGSASGRKRTRREYTDVTLPLSELQVPVLNDEPAGLVEYLRNSFPGQVDEGSILAAVEAGVWKFGIEEPGMGLGNNAAESQDVLAYLEEKTGPRYYWLPALDKLEGWTFCNAALLVFVRACVNKWHKLAQVWAEWNEDLGNNAMEWHELWKVPVLTAVPEVAEEQSRGCEQSHGQEELFRMDLCDEAAHVPDDEYAGHNGCLELDALAAPFFHDFCPDAAFESLTPMVVGSVGTGPAIITGHGDYHATEVFDISEASFYSQWNWVPSSYPASSQPCLVPPPVALVKEEQPSPTHQHTTHEQEPMPAMSTSYGFSSWVMDTSSDGR